MGNIRSRDEKTSSITQEYHIKSLLERYGMVDFNPPYAPGVEEELSLNQHQEKLLNREDEQCFQVIISSAMYLGWVTRYGIGYAELKLTRPIFKLSKTHIAAAKHVLRYVTGTTNFNITFKMGNLKLAAISEANWGDSPDDGKPTSSLYNVTEGNHQLNIPCLNGV